MASNSMDDFYKKALLVSQWFLMLVRWFLFPITINLLPIFSSSFRKRLLFEGQNNIDPLSKAWPEGVKADVAFEVSSEGEFEQAYPLIKVSLEKGFGKTEVTILSSLIETSSQASPIPSLSESN